MDNVKVSIGDGLGFYFFMFVLGMLNAYKVSANIWIGGAVGVIVGVLTLFGAIPVIGVFLYGFVAKWFLGVVGIWLGWVYFVGLAVSILYTVIVGAFLFVWLGWK